MSEFGLVNKMQCPKLRMVVVNVGLKEALNDKGVVNKVVEQITAITGQKPRINRAKKSIATFKLREGDIIGVSVILRGKKMYDFITKLIGVALPRVRDFQGVSNKAFDGNGNYSLGMTEQIVFPEIEYAKIDRIRGLQVNFVTNAGNDKIAKRLFELIGLPFKKEI